MSNAEDLNRLTACSLVLLGHIFYVLGNHRVRQKFAFNPISHSVYAIWPFELNVYSRCHNNQSGTFVLISFNCRITRQNVLPIQSVLVYAVVVQLGPYS